MIAVELVISLIGLTISLVSFYFARKDKGVEQVQSIENRLTSLESNQFTQEDRNCLNELDMKMNLFWGIVEQEFPRLLVRSNTPTIDILLIKASKSGVDSLSATEHKELIERLNVEYVNAIEIEDSGRAMAISLFRATLLYRKSRG